MRKSAAVRSGKRRRWESGKPVGGPVHDGYMLVPELDERGSPITERDGRVVYRRVPDPERAALIRRIFDMVEAGHATGEVARALNAEGWKTVRKREWTTRRVGETIRNPYYAGFITAYRERMGGDHEPLIEPERWQRIAASLGGVDLAAPQRRGQGRRAVEDYLLRRVAFCGRCGSSLFTRRYAAGRHYLCGAVRQARGTCDAAAIAADVAEAQVLARLSTFVGDLEGWIAARAADSDAERTLFREAVEAQRAGLERVGRRGERARSQHDRLLDDGDDQLATQALRQLARIEDERDELARSLAQAEARLSEWEAPDVDAALDYYNELREAIVCRVQSAKSVRDLSAALRTVLEGVWLHTVTDPELGEVLIARFVLRSTNAAGRPPGIALATKLEDWRRVLDEQQPGHRAEADRGTTVTSVAIPLMRVPLGGKAGA